MRHVSHIDKNKKNLELRAQIIRLIREFFWSQGFLEMETPLLLRLPGQEPYLNPMRVILHDERGCEFAAYLHTSPEYALKKMLAAGFDRIFSLGKAFRDRESFGGEHNPEFTMIEWYRSHADMFAIMDDCEALIYHIIQSLEPNDKIENFERLHMRDAWQKYAGVNLDDFLEREAMFNLCVQKGYSPDASEPYEDLFYRIFLNEIEPHLGRERPTIVHHYPARMAALSRLSPDDPRYAERFELYAGGLELANCFSELTDAAEQRRRLEGEREQRRALGKEIFDIDDEFIEAVGDMPPSAGIALGVDRLVQLFAGCRNIDDVILLPASQLFGKQGS